MKLHKRFHSPSNEAVRNPWEVLSSVAQVGEFKFYRGTESKIFFEIIYLVCKLWVIKVQKRSNSLFSGNSNSGHANSTIFCRIISTDVRNKPWKFQCDFLKIGYFTEQSVKWSQMLVYKMRTKSRDFTKFTRWCRVINI